MYLIKDDREERRCKLYIENNKPKEFSRINPLGDLLES